MKNKLNSNYIKEIIAKVFTKKTQELNEENEELQKPIRWVQIRLFPIWLRILLFLILIVVIATIGVMVGYGVIGEGNPKDALRMETWRHIFDIMGGKE